MTSLINNKRISNDSLTFEEQIALATAISKEESAPASKEANTSQQKALETAQEAALKQKQLLKETEKDQAPAPAAASSSSSSKEEGKEGVKALKPEKEQAEAPAPAAASAASSVKKEDKKADDIPPLKPTTNEEWVKHKISSPARFAMRAARPLLLSLYKGAIKEEAAKKIRAIDLGKLETLGDVEKEMLPLIEMCEPRKELHAVIQEQAKGCFDAYVQKGVMAAIDFAKDPK